MGFNFFDKNEENNYYINSVLHNTMFFVFNNLRQVVFNMYAKFCVQPEKYELI